MLSDYHQYDGLGLAALVCEGEVSPAELVDTAIAEIERLDPALNAITQTLYEEARSAAREGVDRDAPFAGVPFLVKDLIATVAGTPTTGSCRILKEHRFAADSELVARFRRAGLMILGKTNTPEFGIMGITEPVLNGPTRNPWDVSRGSGGSSGGSAAAVAARMVPLAHGGDGGGSIRIPASHCGLVGLLPSRGRNPMGPGLGEAWGGLAREHVLTRTVRDSAAMLDCIAGADVGAPYAAPAMTGTSFLAAAQAAPVPLTIAFTKEALYGRDNHPDCVAAVEKTVKLLQDLGHTVEEAKPELDRHALAKAYLMIVCGWVAWEIEHSAGIAGVPVRSGDYELTSWVMGLVGRKNGAIELAKARHICDMAARTMGRFHQRYDLFLTSTTARPPVEVGELYPSGGDAVALNVLKYLPLKSLLNKALDSLAEEALSATPNTQLFNQTGQPALSLPLWQNGEGLPIGVQFAAPLGGEGTLFRIASELEAANPWIDRQPSLLKAV
ncbi:amidase [Sneathiella chinensis]|uniref:6-aminohexanoate-cyclic-dimer hydrolase n=1 Tax=Sneathiella chinensis TaxID=349750 RepID=A0ABQ5U771_9PROT|nr:amidase family protein [Sneathiella chinensis]GLQ06296.1 6-aminohexanoate-cyclic-dimer hydrolase [Sneathiella chinensis]